MALPGVPRSTNYRNESYAGSVAVVGDRLLAAGRVGRSAALWSSEDAGTNWQQVQDPTLASSYAVRSLAVVDDVVVASVEGNDAGLLRSADGGNAWTTVEGLPEAGEDEIASPVWSSGTRLWTLTHVDDYSWNKPEVCYADLSQCGKSPPPLMMASTDGVDWTAVLSLGGYDGITGTTSGRVIALEGNTPKLSVHTLTAGAEPPAAPTRTEPETVRLDTVPRNGSPTVGVRYHAPMYLHCGMDTFHLGSTVWQRTDDGSDLETGAGDRPIEDWPVVGQMLYGYATLTAEDVLEYSIDGGEVIATYEPAKRGSFCD